MFILGRRLLIVFLKSSCALMGLYLTSASSKNPCICITWWILIPTLMQKVKHCFRFDPAAFRDDIFLILPIRLAINRRVSIWSTSPAYLNCLRRQHLLIVVRTSCLLAFSRLKRVISCFLFCFPKRCAALSCLDTLFENLKIRMQGWRQLAVSPLWWPSVPLAKMTVRSRRRSQSGAPGKLRLRSWVCTSSEVLRRQYWYSSFSSPLFDAMVARCIYLPPHNALTLAFQVFWYLATF